MNKRVTIKDLATYTGYSTATVSLVLNNNASSIPESAKEKIIAAAKELNYIPNFAARSLVVGSTKTIGILIPDLSNSFFSSLVYNIQVELSKYDYDIILCNSNEKMENDIKYINLLSSRGVDAMILTLSAESMKEENKDIIRKTLDCVFVPFIFMDRLFDYDAPKIIVDNTKSGEDVARILFDNGHKKIGFITGPLSLDSSRNRLNGAVKFLNQKGITVEKEDIFEGSYDYETGYTGAKIIKERNLTALFAFNDLQAYGVLAYCKENNIKVPEEVSIIGFDNLETSKVVTPALSTVEQPIKDLSLFAYDYIMKIINREEVDKITKLNTKMILRDSVRKI